MSVIAIAGGTNGVGRAISEALKRRGKREFVILSRKANPQLEAEWGIQILPVDYSSIPSLTKSLEDNNIHTVVSALKNTYGETDPDVNLIRAADLSKTTKRYIPSEWGTPLKPEQYEEFPYLKGKLATFNLLKETSLETSIIHIGFFLDYWGIPHYPSYITPFVIGVDIANNVAAIPGSGNTPSVLTHSFTVAEYVALYVESPIWYEDIYIVGNRISMNELLKIAEEVKGTKFKVTHDSLENLRAGKFTRLPGQADVPQDEMQGMLGLFGVWFEDGTFNMDTPHTLNEMFPDVKPLSVKELLEKAWKGK